MTTLRVSLGHGARDARVVGARCQAQVLSPARAGFFPLVTRSTGKLVARSISATDSAEQATPCGSLPDTGGGGAGVGTELVGDVVGGLCAPPVAGPVCRAGPTEAGPPPPHALRTLSAAAAATATASRGSLYRMELMVCMRTSRGLRRALGAGCRK